MATQSGSYDFKAVKALNTSLDQQEVFDRLTNNSANEGIYLENGHIYVNASMIKTGYLSADYIHGGTLTLGGAGNINGTFLIKDANGNTVVQMNNSGSYIKGSLVTNGENVTIGGSYITFAYDGNQYGGLRAKWSTNGQTTYYDLLGWTFSASRPFLQIGSNTRGITIGDPSTTQIDLAASETIAEYFTAERIYANQRITINYSDPWYYAKTTLADAAVGQTVPASGVQFSFGSYIITDKNGYDVGWIEVTKNSNDSLRYRVGFRRTVSGNTIDHNLNLYIESDGTRTVTVSSPAAWRAGLDVAITNHASANTTYGVGTTTNYGHCRTINNLTTSSHTNGYALSAYQGYLLNQMLGRGNFAVRFKTGTINLADGTSSAKTATISLTSTDVPSGYGVWYVLVALGNYLLPYHTPTNTARCTYVSDARAASITITNTASAWSNYTYYLTIILKKN